MSTRIAADLTAIASLVAGAGPDGLSAEDIALHFPLVSRSTINRRLVQLVQEGTVKVSGSGRSTRYLSGSPFTISEINQYFARDWRERPAAPFKESLLARHPGLDAAKAARLQRLQGLAGATDRKFLSNFLIDFSWGSSVLEGGSYSDLDTQALIQYGQRNKDKPVEDAVLVLNHKNAIEYLWDHREISEANLCRMQDMLTDNHGLEEVRDSEHFLPKAQRGIPREYEDVNLGQSAYYPPYRPGSGYIRQALQQIVAIAQGLAPLEAAFYLMTRIPYLQAFANGNKRTSRLAANLPLLAHGLLPISFVDFDKAEYIRGMAAFYELGNIQIIENVFIRGYVRSAIRGSDVPVSMRLRGLDMDHVAGQLCAYVVTGHFPQDPVASAFIAGEDTPATAGPAK